MVEVVLVEKTGKELGLMEKLQAHLNPGQLHKAVSVVLFRTTQVPRSKFQETNKDPNSNNQNTKRIEILIQKRAKTKPLWPLFWANTVCTHPLDGENNLDCAVRRLKEELGISIEKEILNELYTFYYQADYSEVYSEHELDTVIIGEWLPPSHKATGDETVLKINKNEVSEAKWVEWENLKKDLEMNPDIYAPWPKMIFKNQEIINLLKY